MKRRISTTSSLGCKTLCMVFSFLVLCSICLSSSLVHFKKGPEYLTRGKAQVFIPLMRFLFYSLLTSSFLVLLRYFLKTFSFISTCFCVKLKYSQVFERFLFYRVSNTFSFLANSLMSSLYIRWLVFSCNLLNLYPAVHSLSMWLSGIIAIINSSGW